jgi:RNA polymerase sigma-70 factor (ECF subfamily)
MGKHYNHDLAPKISALIRRKVKKLVGNHGFREDDAEDLSQQLAMHVIEAMRRYDPARAAVATYADRVVTSRAASIVTHATAKKRDRRRERRLHETPKSQMPVDDSKPAAWDTSIDVNEALARLPDDLRHVALLFTVFTEAEVVRHSGLSRQTVRRMRRQIAEHLRRCWPR